MHLIRKFVAAALALAVLTAPALAFQGAEPAPAASEINRYLVNEAEVVFKINVKQLLGSGLVKGKKDEIKDLVKSNKDLSNLLDATNIDVTKDIDLIVVSAAGTSAKDAKANLLIKGTFDLDKITTALKKREEVRPIKEGTIQLYEFSARDQTLVGSFVDNKTLILTNSKETTVNLVKGEKKPAMHKSMKEALSRFTGKESMSLAVVINDELKKQLENAPGGVGDSAGKLQIVTAALTVTDGVAMNLTGVTNDAKAAKALADLLEKGKQGGKMALAGNDQVPPFVADLLDAVKIAGMKDSVTVNLKIAKETIDKIMKLGGVR